MSDYWISSCIQAALNQTSHLIGLGRSLTQTPIRNRSGLVKERLLCSNHFSKPIRPTPDGVFSITLIPTELLSHRLKKGT